MISADVHILTNKDLERIRSVCFQKGVERGKLEARQESAGQEPKSDCIPELEELAARPYHQATRPAQHEPLALVQRPPPAGPNIKPFVADTDGREQTFVDV